MFSEHQIEHMFGHTAASIEGPNPKAETHADIRRAFKHMARVLDDSVPDSFEKDQAFIELQAAAMWFHKALAHNS